MTQLPWLTEYPWGDKIHSILQPLFTWLVNLPKIQLDNVLFWYINRNSFAGVSMVILPLTWPLAHMSSRWESRGVAILAAVLLIAILVISAGITSLVALLFGWALISLVSGKFFRAIVATLVIPFLAVMLVVFQPGSTLLSYILANVAIRLDLWQSALCMIRDFPLTGVGPGMENWFFALTNYALPSFSTLKDGEVVIWPSSMHAHNFYLQTWAEQGILGFVALVAIVVVGLVLGARYLRSAQGFRRAVVFGGLWSFTAYAIHSLVDSGPSTPGAIGLWAMLGLMVAAGEQQQARSIGSVENFIDGPTHKEVDEAAPHKLGWSLITIMGVVEWLGLSLFLTLASLALIGSHPLLGVVAAFGAGLALAMASLSLHDARAERRV